MGPLLSGGTESIQIDAFLYLFGIWVAMAVVAVVNGGFRGVVLIPRVGNYIGHVLSTGLLVAAILLISFVYFRRTPIEYSAIKLVLVGLLWTVLTVGFEFLVGYVEGTPTSVTFGQYNVLAGQIWIDVPLTLLF